jgi:uncharacterized membrane-anchored protein
MALACPRGSPLKYRMRGLGLVASLVALLAFPVSAWSKTSTTPGHESAPAEVADGTGEGGADQRLRPVIGPKTIELGDALVLDLPADMGYFDRATGKTLMEKMGNQVGDDFRGLVFKKDSGWLIEIGYVSDGYVKDDDAGNLKPDEILKSIHDGTEEANEFRKQKGFPAIHVDAWTEPPRYERAQHHLIWGISGKHDDGTSASINFYTRVLGRRGYVALNLMDDPKTIEASKADGLTVLRATTFKPGARYQDFNAKSDKVAEYGLAALVAGGAGAVALKLVKVGLLAKFGTKILALLIAGKKLLVLLLVSVGAGIKRLIGGRKQKPEAAPPSTPSPPDQPVL